MKNTPNVNAQPSANANGQRANFTITPGEAVPVSKLIEAAKLQNPDAIKEPTTYPKPLQSEEAPTPVPVAAPPAPAPALVEPAKPTEAKPVRSRAEEIEFQIEKAAKLQLLNVQLQSLKTKQAELKQFSYTVNKDDDSRFGRIVIYDDNNREFVCKNHGLAAIVVESLKTLFGDKIEEKENELLSVSQS